MNTVNKLRWIWDELKTHPARLMSLVSAGVIAGTLTFAMNYAPVASLDFPDTPTSSPVSTPSEYVAQPSQAPIEHIARTAGVDRSRPRPEVTNNDVSEPKNGNTDEPTPVEETKAPSTAEPKPTTATSTYVAPPQCTSPNPDDCKPGK